VSESELNDMKRLCVQAYKNAWYLPQATASTLLIIPKTHAGKQSTLPMAVLTQEMLLHAERCMRHEDMVQKILLAGQTALWTISYTTLLLNKLSKLNNGSEMTQPEMCKMFINNRKS